MKKNDLIHKIRQQCQHIDRVYWLLFGLLIIVAILALFSASSTWLLQEETPYPQLWIKCCLSVQES